jgi:cobyrinic acid a,c-diamide synthase
VTLGILARLRRMGLEPQPFKVGPDFIDPSLHTSVTGRASRNLDSFMNTDAVNRDIFLRASKTSRVAVIEGAMGLFDGYSGADERGSSAHMAKILSAPVILVVDASASCRSIAAVVKGFESFDPKVRVAGVFLNKVASERHLAWLKESLLRYVKAELVGYAFSDSRLQMAERHLGLIPAAEKSLPKEWMERLDHQLKKQVNWAKLLQIARSAPALSVPAHSFFPPRMRAKTAIAVARDAAFCFYYQDNLDFLEAYGAEIIPFSPMKESLPQEAKGLYLGGGYPELWGKELAANRSLRREVAMKSKTGFPIYGECGGLMYLGKTLKDFKGRTHAMTGALPYSTEMNPRMKLAYVQVTVKKNNLIAKTGTRFRAHIFHFSDLKPEGALRYSYRLDDGKNKFPDGIVLKNTLASYGHVHFASQPSLAKHFVDACV